MNVMYKFKPHSFELPIKRTKEIECRVWEASHPNPSIAVLEYDFGKDLEDKELQSLAEHIVSNYNMSVVAVEYAETKVKYSPQLLKKLESYLPDHLRKCSKYLSERHQGLIEQGAFQDVINDLQYNPYISVPVTKDTIISLYGDENSYTDFGVAASLDIIYSLEQLKNKYPLWKWNDCIGIGVGYGAYILHMAERFSPNTFSMIIGKNSLIKPIASDLFANRTELDNGTNEFIYRKNIGKFPLYLNEVQGWTTDKTHPFYLERRHYDIRNLENDIFLQRSNKQTPLVFIEEINSRDLQKKIDFIEKLIKNDYPVELFIPEEDEVDNQIATKENGIVKVNLIGLFDFYMDKEYSRNFKSNHENKITILPVFNGVYIFNNKVNLPKFFYIPANKELTASNELEYLFTFFKEELNELDQNSVEEILYFVKNPLSHQDIDYVNIIK